MREVGARPGAPQLHRGPVVRARRLLGRVERAQPHARTLLWVADLRHPPALVPLTHTAEQLWLITVVVVVDTVIVYLVATLRPVCLLLSVPRP